MRSFRSRGLVAATVLLLLVLGLVLAQEWRHRDRSRVVEESGGWKTVEYAGVRVEVPASWERADRGDCEFAFEQWAPAGADPCDQRRSVAFYREATFDPATGPGVRRSTDSGGGWAGYAGTGEWVVYASDTDRGVVSRVLRSARATGAGQR